MKEYKKIKSLLEQGKISYTRIIKLAGDASDRKFFRILSPNKSYVFLLYPGPFDKNLNLLSAHKLYSSAHLPVPKIINVWLEQGALLLQDLGNMSLQRYSKIINSEERKNIYFQAINLIQKIQIEAGKNLNSSYFASHHKLDKEKLLWELNFFLENYIQNFLKKQITSGLRDKYENEFNALLDLIDFRKMVLCHRDYHSRNLFIVDHKIFLVDYQDSRLGPPLYDLASLLFDSYLKIEKKLKKELIQYAYSLNNYGWNKDEYFSQLILTSLQRNIKALGTFGYQISIKKRKRYLSYIPRTLKYIQENVKYFSPLKSLERLMKDWV
ncbi:MAG: aminoglycoside phosphotransferase family protein [Candidatus Aminicenantia bacterium]